MSAINLVGVFFDWSPFIHDGWLSVDATNPKPSTYYMSNSKEMYHPSHRLPCMKT